MGLLAMLSYGSFVPLWAYSGSFVRDFRPDMSYQFLVTMLDLKLPVLRMSYSWAQLWIVFLRLKFLV